MSITWIKVPVRQVLIVLGFNDRSTLVVHFVSSPRERKTRERRGVVQEMRGTGGKRKTNEREETEINK